MPSRKKPPKPELTWAEWIVVDTRNGGAIIYTSRKPTQGSAIREFLSQLGEPDSAWAEWQKIGYAVCRVHCRVELPEES